MACPMYVAHHQSHRGLGRPKTPTHADRSRPRAQHVHDQVQRDPPRVGGWVQTNKRHAGDRAAPPAGRHLSRGRRQHSSSPSAHEEGRVAKAEDASIWRPSACMQISLISSHLSLSHASPGELPARRTSRLSRGAAPHSLWRPSLVPHAELSRARRAERVSGFCF